MSKAFWQKYSIKDVTPDHPDHQQPSKPFVTPGLANRQEQSANANLEEMTVNQNTGPMGMFGPAVSSADRNARSVASKKADVARNALERQRQEAVRRYGKDKP